ncbi:MAG: hypothetical protein AB7O89_01470 [Parachlamydiales bacterium]
MIFHIGLLFYVLTKPVHDQGRFTCFALHKVHWTFEESSQPRCPND